MRYSYEHKKKCVELYRQEKWPETPDGVKEKRFHDTVRIWVRIEDACGSEALRHKIKTKCDRYIIRNIALAERSTVQ